ncbi:MAG: helix-turn-helix transcriptional regulator [Shimia sp.]
MRRQDRLIALIQLLKDGRLHRGQDIAERLGVSLRTVYRDMETLAASGVPVEGERGIGYAITAQVTLPPLNLTTTELEALLLGLAVVAQGGDEEVRGAAKTLSAKLDAVLPEDRSGVPEGFAFSVYPFADAAKGFRHMPPLRAAIRTRQKVEVTYEAPGEDAARRTLRPLKLDYWGRVWTITAWDETHGAFDTLRVDRITALRVLPAIFMEEAGKTLADYTALSG